MPPPQTCLSGKRPTGVFSDPPHLLRSAAFQPDHTRWGQGAVVDGYITGDAVQSNVHDTRFGKLLRVGGFGWGQSGDAQVNVALDNTTTSGVHQFSPLDRPSPLLNTGGPFLVIRYSSELCPKASPCGARVRSAISHWSTFASD